MDNEELVNSISKKKVFAITFFWMPDTVRIIFEDGSHFDISPQYDDELHLDYVENKYQIK